MGHTMFVTADDDTTKYPIFEGSPEDEPVNLQDAKDRKFPYYTTTVVSPDPGIIYLLALHEGQKVWMKFQQVPAASYPEE